MNTIHQNEKGQVLVILTVGIVVLLGFAALAIDGGMLYSDRRHDQNVADNAALAGGLAAANYFNDNDVQTEGLACNSAAVTGAKNAAYAAAEISVEDAFPGAGEEEKHVTGDHDISDGHGVYVECSASDQQLFVTVRLTVKTQSFLSQLVYQGDLQNTVEAVARAKPGINGELFGGAAIVSLRKTGTGYKFNSSQVVVNGGGMFVNSSDPLALDSNWNPKLYSDRCVGVVGGISPEFFTENYKAGEVTGAGFCTPKPSQLDLPADYFSDLVPAPPAPPTCSTAGSISQRPGGGIIATPGNYPGNFTVPYNGGTLQSGVYCFGGNFIVTGGQAASVTGGDVTMVFTGNHGVTIGGDTTNYFDSLIVHIVNGDWIKNGSANLTVPGVFRFYATGDADYHIAGGSVDTFNDGFFYLTGGTFKLEGSTTMNLTGPTSGPYKGLSVYMPIENTSDVWIRGDGHVNVTGSMVIPGAHVRFEGSSNLTAYNSQIIADDFAMNGGSKLVINYDADQNINAPQPPTLELYK